MAKFGAYEAFLISLQYSSKRKKLLRRFITLSIAIFTPALNKFAVTLPLLLSDLQTAQKQTRDGTAVLLLYPKELQYLPPCACVSCAPRRSPAQNTGVLKAELPTPLLKNKSQFHLPSSLTFKRCWWLIVMPSKKGHWRNFVV